MKTLNCIILFLIISINANAQNDSVFIRYDIDGHDDTLTYTTDTLIFPTSMQRYYLAGTCMLPGTSGRYEAYGNGFYFKDVEITQCQSDDPPIGNSKIVSVKLKDSVLVVQTSLVENCCYSFLCDVDITDDGILNLIYYGYGNLCACDCCFGLTYYFDITETSNDFRVKSVILNGDPATLKKL